MSRTTDDRNKFQKIVWGLFWLTTPDYWRRLLTGRARVRIYLSSGESFKVSVAAINVSLNGNSKSYSASGISNSFSLDAGELIGFKEVLYW